MRRNSAGGFTIIDLLVVLVLILLISSVTLALAADESEMANRVKCASNLKQLGMAMLLYANEQHPIGSYPRGLYDVPTADKPVAYTHPTVKESQEEQDQHIDPMYCKAGPGPNDVTAAYFRLLQQEEISADVFHCPSVIVSATQPVEDADIKTQCNFTGHAQLDYSFANPYPDDNAAAEHYELTSSASPEFAIAADMNPGTKNLLTIKTDAPEEQLKKMNSTNHGGDGQNILYGDGHVEFQQNVYCGANRDNVYTFGNSGIDPATHKMLGPGDGIIGSPVGPNDSILLPTAEQK